MKRFYLFFLFLALALPVLLVSSCGENSKENSLDDNFDVSFTLPSSIDAEPEGTVEFSVLNGKAPLVSDVFMLTGSDGISKNCTIVSSTTEAFSIRLARGVESGQYSVYLKRDTRKKLIGSTYINIGQSVDVDLDKGTTVWGLVSCGEEGVPGVVVSDGVEVVVTDKNGIYQIKSAKKWGYVFISVPSGYEVPSEGIMPKFHVTLRGDAQTVERADFTLVKAAGQERHTMFFLGDMHLANRTDDLSQFTAVTNDWNRYRDAHKSENMYAMTLGDMTWDLYWYTNSYEFPQYLDDMNKRVSDIQIFHTMGNHDNDMKAKNDFDAAFNYVKKMVPTYYSFNIGKIHYMVIDDIDCSNYDGSNRDYSKKLSQEQLDWIKKDLVYVDKSTPLVITTHAQIFKCSGDKNFVIDHDVTGTKALFNALSGHTVHFVTGHTHEIYNVNPEQSSVWGATNTYEHNAGSLCGSWWWSGKLTPGVWVSPCGAPSGYSIWEIDGTDIKWKYKATGWDENYQFRAYDLNNISFSLADVPNMPSSLESKFKPYMDAYPGTKKNEVLINIWNWNSNWTLKVTDENGKELTPVQCRAYDPLHIAALTVKRFNSSSITSAPNFITENFVHHFFKVTADNADVDLTITATDEFGNVYTENMARPKKFDVSDFAKK